MKLSKQIKIVFIDNIRSSFAGHLKSEISFGTSCIMQKQHFHILYISYLDIPTLILFFVFQIYQRYWNGWHKAAS